MKQLYECFMDVAMFPLLTRLSKQKPAVSFPPFPYYEHDNLGGGHCGYYALMMGIIHLAKSPETRDIMQHTIENWKAFDPSISSMLDEALSDDVNIFEDTKIIRTNEISPQPEELRLKYQRIFQLQKSLRKILFDKICETLPQTIDAFYSGPPDSYAYGEFCFIVEALRPGANFLRVDLQSNSLYQQEIVQLARAVNYILDNINYPKNPKLETLEREDFIANVFVKYRDTLVKAYEKHFVGTETSTSTRWATEKCLLKLAECLDVPLQFFVNRRPVAGNVMPLNEVGIRLNNINNAHWTLFIPKETIASQASLSVLPNIPQTSDFKARMLKERDKRFIPVMEHFLEKEPALKLLSDQLIELSNQERNNDIYENLQQQFSDLTGLDAAHKSLDDYLALSDQDDTYDEHILRLNLAASQLKFNQELSEQEKLIQNQRIEQEKLDRKQAVINEKRQNLPSRFEALEALIKESEFRAQQEKSKAKSKANPTTTKPTTKPTTKCAPQKNNAQTKSEGQDDKTKALQRPRHRKFLRKKSTSYYPAYVLNGCVGGFVLGGIIIGSSPELIAATVGLLSIPSVGAILLLLLASIFIAAMITILSLYAMDCYKSSVAPTR